MTLLNLLFLVSICNASITTFYFQATLNCRIQQYWYYEVNYYEHDPGLNDFLASSGRLNFNGENLHKTSYSVGSQDEDGLWENKLYEPMVKIYHNCTKDSADKMEEIYLMKKPVNAPKLYFAIKGNLDDINSLDISQ